MLTSALPIKRSMAMSFRSNTVQFMKGSSKQSSWQNLVSGPFRALDVIQVTGCAVAGGLLFGWSLPLPRWLAAAIVLEPA